MGKGDTNIYYNMVEKARTACRPGDLRCSCAKVSLVIISILLMVCGFVAIALRVWIHFERQHLDTILEEVEAIYTDTSLVYKYVWYTLYLAICIAVAVYVFLAGVFGIVFAFQQNPRFYIMTMIASLFACALCLAIGIGLPVVAALNPYNEVLVVYNNMANENYEDPGNSFWAMVDQTQSENQCCGVTGDEDYSVVDFYGRYGRYYPFSCCMLNSGQAPGNNIGEDNVLWNACSIAPRPALYREGCGDKFIVDSSAAVLMIQYIYGTALGVAVLLIISIIFAVVLYINPT